LRKPSPVLGPILAVLCLALAAGVLLGSSSAGASVTREKPKSIVILSELPDPPVAGLPYTITYTVLQGDKQVDIVDHDCFARTKKIFRLALVDRSRDGNVVSCTWDIPLKAQGQQLYGILAAILANDERTFRSVERRIQ
jgi:hypothetical protein